MTVHKNKLFEGHLCGLNNNKTVKIRKCCAADWKHVTCEKCLKLKGHRKRVRVYYGRGR